MMTLEKLEKRLNSIKEMFGENEPFEVFIKVKEFPNYLVSNFGRVKVLEHSIVKKTPRGDTEAKYTYKSKIMKPLYAGPSRKWTQVRMFTGKGKWRQLSVMKVMISAFLNIPINELPHSIYFKDRNF